MSSIPFLIAIQVLLFGPPLFASEEAEYKCKRYSANSTEDCGTLSVRDLGKKTYISVKQLCLSFGCGTLYQWNLQKIIIKNSREKTNAILSPFSKIALIDGSVFDLEDPLITDAKEGYLLPIDFATKLVLNLKLGAVDKKILKKKEESKDESISDVQVFPQKKLEVLVIDPGHGGNDQGTSFQGLTEKDVALIYSLKLKEEIEKQIPDIDVYLTRTEDVFVSLLDRSKFANEKKADLFLSLHLNHAANSKIEGSETYILSPEATDNDSRKLALMENESWLKTAQIKPIDNTVQKLLIDLEQTKYIQNSALAAAMVQQELGGLNKKFGLKNRGVKQALFYVLSQVAMPSALVEMGFLSNTGDRGRLMNVNFRNEFINKLVFAIKRYRNRNDLINKQK